MMHVGWALTLALRIAPSASTPPPSSPDTLPLVALCAQRLGKPNAEITLVAALDSHGVIALDQIDTPLPKLLRRAARQTWFAIAPSGTASTTEGAALIKQARLDADGDAQHVRLGPCNVPGTVYATRRMAAAALSKSSPSTLQRATESRSHATRCIEEAWDHGNGRVEVLGRDAGDAADPNVAACHSKPAQWLMLDPHSPAPKQGPQGVVAIYARSTAALATPVLVNHIHIDGRLLTWVLEQDDVSVSCSVIDDTFAPSLDMLRIEIEDRGC